MPKGKCGFQKGNKFGLNLRQTEDQAVIKLLLASEEKNGGCICATKYLNDKGYPRMRVNAKKRYMSHVMYERYIGEMPDGMCVLHKCDIPSCINPQHLFIGTKADNNYDMVSKGRHYVHGKGEKSCRATITDKQAKEIKMEYKPRVVTASYLAEKYGTTRAVVNNIVQNKSWRHIE